MYTVKINFIDNLVKKYNNPILLFVKLMKGYINDWYK